MKNWILNLFKSKESMANDEYIKSVIDLDRKLLIKEPSKGNIINALNDQFNKNGYGFTSKEDEIKFKLELNKAKDNVSKTLGDYGSRYERPKRKGDLFGGFVYPNFTKYLIIFITILLLLPFIIKLISILI